VGITTVSLRSRDTDHDVEKECAPRDRTRVDRRPVCEETLTERLPHACASGYSIAKTDAVGATTRPLYTLASLRLIATLPALASARGRGRDGRDTRRSVLPLEVDT
jgi:hypothetical protein